MAPSSSDSLGFDPGERGHESEARAVALKLKENHRNVLQLYRVRVSDDPTEYETHPWRHSERADYVGNPDHTKWAMVQWDRDTNAWVRPMGPVKEWQEEMLDLPAPTKQDFAELARREQELSEHTQL